MKKIIPKILLILVLLNSFALPVLAEDYTVLAPLPGTTQGSCQKPGDAGCKTTLTEYLPGIFTLAIGLAALAAVLMIIWGGIQYMTTDAIQGKESGKKRIWDSITSLLFIIGAWVILYTINPDLLKLNLRISPVPIAPPAGAEGTLSPALPTQDVMNKIMATCPNCSIAGGLTFNISPANLARFDCQNCSAFAPGIPYSGNTGINVQPSLNSKLSALNNGLKQQGVEWQVTEAFPPVVNHADSCHYNGSCVDVKLTAPTDLDIKKFFETARNNGFSTVIYEVRSKAEETRLAGELQRMGLSNAVAGGNIKYNPNASGAHFHIEN